MIDDLRLRAQKAVKSVTRVFGLEIRYAFNNLPIYSPLIYGRWVNPADARCIFDVGANIGQSAKAFAKAFPNAVVYSFEPFPAAFHELAITGAKFKGRVKPYKLALGDEDHVVVTSVNPSSKSVENKVTPGSNGASVQVTTIDSFCSREGITTIDILKTDTEGYDARVLRGANEMLGQKRIRCIISEFGFIGDPQRTSFEDVYDILHANGYRFAGLYEATHTHAGECFFANALFA
jgi:FkbM family methyltransferase